MEQDAPLFDIGYWNQAENTRLTLQIMKDRRLSAVLKALGIEIDLESEREGGDADWIAQDGLVLDAKGNVLCACRLGALGYAAGCREAEQIVREHNLCQRIRRQLARSTW